jgi:hypothetical protein
MKNIDVDLVQPTGMDGKMDDNDLRSVALKAPDGGQSPVRRAVVDNQENPSGGTVRFTGHGVRNQAGKGYDPGLGLAPAEHLCPSHVPGSKIAHRSPSCLFKFHLLPLSCWCTKAHMSSLPGLNTGLFVSGDRKVVRSQLKSIPHLLIEVQNTAEFLLRQGTPGEGPAPVLPCLDGILSKP